MQINESDIYLVSNIALWKLFEFFINLFLLFHLIVQLISTPQTINMTLSSQLLIVTGLVTDPIQDIQFCGNIYLGETEGRVLILFSTELYSQNCHSDSLYSTTPCLMWPSSRPTNDFRYIIALYLATHCLTRLTTVIWTVRNVQRTVFSDSVMKDNSYPISHCISGLENLLDLLSITKKKKGLNAIFSRDMIRFFF